ncbi:MAG: hypothetical protein WKF71_10745 [Pyrinomonadaceae bacterium]
MFTAFRVTNGNRNIPDAATTSRRFIKLFGDDSEFLWKRLELSKSVLPNPILHRSIKNSARAWIPHSAKLFQPYLLTRMDNKRRASQLNLYHTSARPENT